MRKVAQGRSSIPGIVVGHLLSQTIYNVLAQEVPRIYEEHTPTLWSKPSEEELINIALARAYTRKALDLQRTQLGLLTRYTLSLLDPQRSAPASPTIRRRGILR